MILPELRVNHDLEPDIEGTWAQVTCNGHVSSTIDVDAYELRRERRLPSS